jgi:beta-RFAP synthase
MSCSGVTVTANSRLHFGMFSFGHAQARQFGGVGAMVDTPALELQIKRAANWQFSGQHADRVAKTVKVLQEHSQLCDCGPCEVHVAAAPPQHVGMGVGTQLTLAVVAGLASLADRWPLDAIQLAKLSSRAQRSAIGTYGFLHGGLLVDGGKLPGDLIGPLEHRVSLPDTWRFLLSCPIAPSPFGRGQGEGIKDIGTVIQSSPSGLHGTAEREAFDTLPPVPAQVTQQLRNLVFDELIPAAVSVNFNRFGEALFQFGELAGQCFAPAQGGSFATPEIASFVAKLRNYGVRGVGQTSWGPTVFSLLPSADEAAKLVAWLNDEYGPQAYQHHIAQPANQPATIRTW